MEQTKEQKEQEILNSLPDRVLSIQRNNTTLDFPAVVGKRGDWEGIPFYVPKKDAPVDTIIKWVGEKFARQAVLQRLRLVAQEAYWRATHRPTGKKDDKGNEIEESKEFDKDFFVETLSNLRVTGLNIKALQTELDELLEELAGASAAMEAAKASGDATKLMAVMTEWADLAKEINNVQAEIKSRKRPRDEASE